MFLKELHYFHLTNIGGLHGKQKTLILAPFTILSTGGKITRIDRIKND